MKITIDTKEDSHEEIKKLIRMLSHMVGENAARNFEAPAARDVFADNSKSLSISEDMGEEGNILESAPAQSSRGVFGNMFDNPVQSTEKKAGEEDEEEEPQKPPIIELEEY